MFVAIMLCMLVILVWQYFYVLPEQEKARKMAPIAEQNANITVKPVEPETKPVVTPDRAEVINSTNADRVKISTPSLHGSLSLVGLRIDDLTLAGYRQELDKNSKEVALLSPQGTKEAYFSEFGWLITDNTIKTPDSKTVWKADKHQIGVNDPVKMTWDNGQGVVFSKIISVDENYMFTITQAVDNKSGKAITIVPYGLLSRTMPDMKHVYISHEGPIGVFNDKLEEVTYDDIKDEAQKNYRNAFGWLGIADKYWLAALIPSRDVAFEAKFSHALKDNLHRYQVDFASKGISLPNDSQSTITHRLFAGAKKIDLLDNYSKTLGIPLFDRSVDFGILYFLTRPMAEALKYFYGHVGNFGIAILLLTIVVKLLVFPLANKSYKSMARMKKVMPELTAIRDRYKEDRQKMNQEMMKFYTERKINPMSGCLPLLVQIPIFFALYKVLYVSIEMRHAPFYGWIHDLSAQDPTNIFNLFGLLAWNPPSWIPVIGILPILFCVTMVIQQWLNPPATDPVQDTMIKTMPFIFLFVFASFPAGLVLYWTWSNILSIIQQRIIIRGVMEEKGK